MVDPELGQEAPEVEEEEQGRGDGAEEEGVACHICLMQISTGEQESGMMFCDCDTSFRHLSTLNFLMILDVPLKCEIHNFDIFLFIK